MLINYSTLVIIKYEIHPGEIIIKFISLQFIENHYTLLSRLKLLVSV